MALVRLFANLREFVGSGRVTIDASTVGEALDQMRADYGTAFDQGLAQARVWVNGDPADDDTPLVATDEIAIIPPVSGGAEAAYSPGIPVGVVASAAGLVILAVANALEAPAFFVAALVGVLGAWGMDIVTTSRETRTGLRAAPLITSLFVGTTAGWWFAGEGSGSAGLGVAVVGAIVITLVMASFRRAPRNVESLAGTALIASYGAVAGAGLAVTRLSSTGQLMLWIFLGIITAGALAAWAVRVFPALAVVDPLVAGALGTVVTALAIALLIDLDVVGFLFISILVALASIAGRALGSLGRTGELWLADPAPGFLASFDGAVLAGAVYLFGITFFV